jgi:hypothetical protein
VDGGVRARCVRGVRRREPEAVDDVVELSRADDDDACGRVGGSRS